MMTRLSVSVLAVAAVHALSSLWLPAACAPDPTEASVRESGKWASRAAVPVVTTSAGAPATPVLLSDAPPPNDTCQGAWVLTGSPAQASQLTTEATSGEFDPALPCGSATYPKGGHTVWFAFTPSASGRYEANTFGSDYDTVLAVMTGPCAAHTQIACGDDTATPQSQVFWDAEAGTTYYLEVASFGIAPGGYLHIYLRGLPPPNDNCTGARGLLGQEGTHTQSISFATVESGEPAHSCGASNQTVWFSLEPEETGVALLSTAGSDYDTMLAVYRGSCGGPWIEIACNDDVKGVFSYAVRWSELAVEVQAGVRYLVQVGSFSPVENGTLHLSHVLGPLPTPIADVKCLPLETRVTIEDAALTGDLAGFPEVQQKDRASGIHLSMTHDARGQAGSVVTAIGVLKESDGNLYLHEGGFVHTGVAGVRPLIMTSEEVGGDRHCRQAGRPGGLGPNNISLLVQVCGWVTGVEPAPGWYWVDDGCGLVTDAPHEGIRVWTLGSTLPAVGDFVKVTGSPWIWAPTFTPILREFGVDYLIGSPLAVPLASGPEPPAAGVDPAVGN